MSVVQHHPSLLSMTPVNRAIWRLGNAQYEFGRRLIDNRWNLLSLIRMGERVAVGGIALRVLANHGIPYWLHKTRVKRANRGQ